MPRRSRSSRKRELVDHHVTPVRIVGRQIGDVRESLALPRRIVVVEDRRPTLQHLGDHT